MKNYLFLLCVACLSIVFTSCDDHDHGENEGELITTIRYTLTPESGTPVVMEFKDLDGDGGNAPVINTIGSLKTNVSYSGSLLLLNESVSPAEDITKEIKEEDKDHQFFFEISGALKDKLTVAYADKDGDSNPIGLLTSVVATTAGTGKLKITLRHEPNKKASGVSSGLIANAGGETDIEVTFDVKVD
jgi:hypothetical protein